MGGGKAKSVNCARVVCGCVFFSKVTRRSYRFVCRKCGMITGLGFGLGVVAHSQSEKVASQPALCTQSSLVVVQCDCEMAVRISKKPTILDVIVCFVETRWCEMSSFWARVVG